MGEKSSRGRWQRLAGLLDFVFDDLCEHLRLEHALVQLYELRTRVDAAHGLQRVHAAHGSAQYILGALAARLVADGAARCGCARGCARFGAGGRRLGGLQLLLDAILKSQQPSNRTSSCIKRVSAMRRDSPYSPLVMSAPCRSVH